MASESRTAVGREPFPRKYDWIKVTGTSKTRDQHDSVKWIYGRPRDRRPVPRTRQSAVIHAPRKVRGRSYRKCDKLYVSPPSDGGPRSDILIHCNQNSASLEKSKTPRKSNLHPAHLRASKNTRRRRTTSLNARGPRPSTRQTCEGHTRRGPRRRESDPFINYNPRALHRRSNRQ